MAVFVLDLQNTETVTAGNTFGTAVSATGILTQLDLNNEATVRMSAMVTSTAVAGAGTAAIKIQQSDDNVTFADITGATFTTISAANALQMISFNATKRYIAGFATITGTSVTFQLTFFTLPKMTPVGTAGGWVNEQYSNP